MIDLSNTVITLTNHNNNIDNLFYSTNLNNSITSSNNATNTSGQQAQQQTSTQQMPNIFLNSQANSSAMNGASTKTAQLIDYDQYNNNTNYLNNNNSNNSNGTAANYSNDANKAFDDVVFDILKVDPDDIAGQLTLIDVPLFKAIEPDELISCKWMSREKLIKAPNIVHFTRRFNQTTFWCQKEILNCKRIEKRGKMITHFIKIAKHLNELHSFNSLMAIIVALKSAPIYRLKKTWSQHVSKRDTTQFERLADLMFDTSDNKRKIRDMHMNCKLPCIPFLGLFLTDLIHIDIAHPHNSFDNPQRRNQMNNICRLISEYQQSNYQDLTSLSCSCCFNTTSTNANLVNNLDNNNDKLNNSNLCKLNNMNSSCSPNSILMNPNTNNNSLNENNECYDVCLVQNCSCAIHHGNGYGGGIINSDGTIYISEIKYVKNYLNSFLYIEELQKFKEDENYRDSLELEPDPASVNTNANTNLNVNDANLKNGDLSLTPSINYSMSSPNRLFLANQMNGGVKHGLTSYTSAVNSSTTSSNHTSNNLNHLLGNQHRKTLSLATNVNNFQLDTNNSLINETKDFINELKHHPLDDSIVVDSTANTNSTVVTVAVPVVPPVVVTGTEGSSSSAISNINGDLILNELPNLNLNLNLSKEQQKKLLNSVKLNDPPSLLKELLKHRHSSASQVGTQNFQNDYFIAALSPSQNAASNSKSSHHTLKNKFSCYSANTADLDSESDGCNEMMDHEVNHASSTPSSRSNSHSASANGAACSNNESSTSKAKNNGKSLNRTLTSSNGSSGSRRISGRNLSHSFRDEENKNNNNLDCLDSSNTNNNNRISVDESVTSQAWPSLSNSLELTNTSLINSFIQTSLIQFESPIKRKCIIKNYRKPRFSQWKSYWLQLVGGNLLIYYPSKVLHFNRVSSGGVIANGTTNLLTLNSQNSTNEPSNSNGSSRRSSNQSTNEQSNFLDQLERLTTSNQSNGIINENEQLTSTSNQEKLVKQLIEKHKELNKQTQELQMQQQPRKVFYHKNPCKMHPIANWMVVSLFQDKESEILAAQAHAQETNTTYHCPHTKFDIQLNDLNNGNMYKYRFDSLQLAQEWLEQFKLASTYHERQKPDNLIRFD